MIRFVAAFLPAISLAAPAMAQAEQPLIGAALSYSDTIPKRHGAPPLAEMAHGGGLHASKGHAAHTKSKHHSSHSLTKKKR